MISPATGRPRRGAAVFIHSVAGVNARERDKMFKLTGYVGTRANGYEGCACNSVFRLGDFSQPKETSSRITFQAELRGAENHIALSMEIH